MSETAIHLVDHVLPIKPIRQWVISFPFQLRLLLAIRLKIMGDVLRITHEAIAQHLRQKAGLKKDKGKVGAVTLVQRQQSPPIQARLFYIGRRKIRQIGFKTLCRYSLLSPLGHEAVPGF